MGLGGAKGWDLCPHPYRMTRKIFLPHPRPLRPYEVPPLPEKLYLLLICPQLLHFFFNKTYFINKNILEITNKFISSNQTNF